MTLKDLLTYPKFKESINNYFSSDYIKRLPEGYDYILNEFDGTLLHNEGNGNISYVNIRNFPNVQSADGQHVIHFIVDYGKCFLFQNDEPILFIDIYDLENVLIHDNVAVMIGRDVCKTLNLDTQELIEHQIR